MTTDSIDLLNRIQGGDEAAATELFDRYVGRMIALAGSRLSSAMKRRVAPEDIVQSACRSFFRNAAENKFEMQQPGQLWGLLAAITINKVRDQAKFHSAQKRNVSSESSMNASRSCYGLVPATLVDEPTTAEVAEMEEQLARILNGMPGLKRSIFELYLQNQSPAEIASQVRRSMRTVRRTLEEIRTELEQEIMG